MLNLVGHIVTTGPHMYILRVSKDGALNPIHGIFYGTISRILIEDATHTERAVLCTCKCRNVRHYKQYAFAPFHKPVNFRFVR
jgi:hypothetical protein